MTDLSPEARRMLAKARIGQASAPEALRARVKDNVTRAIAAAAIGGNRPLVHIGRDEVVAVTRGGSKLPVWALPTVGALAVLGGLAVIATQPPAASKALPSAIATQPAAATEPEPAVRELQPAVSSPVPSMRASQPAVASVPEPAVREPQPSAANEIVSPVGAVGERNTIAPRLAAPVARSSDVEMKQAIAPSVSEERARKPSAAGPDDLRAEMQLLSRAEAALRSDDPQGALQVLRTHAQQFRRGQLQDEREGLRLIALCALGRDPKTALAHYLDKKGDAVLHARVLEACSGRTQ